LWQKILTLLLTGPAPFVVQLRHAGRGTLALIELDVSVVFLDVRENACDPSCFAQPRTASTAFLYFVAKHDGSHAFSTNIEEHNRNVELYQRQWYRDQRAATAQQTVQGPGQQQR